MADDTDVLLKFCEQQWIEAKQAEDQRATMTNYIVAIAAAVIGVISQNSSTEGVPYLSMLLIVLGIYGGLASRKLYERHQFHIARLIAWRKRVDELHPDAQILELKTAAVADHEKKFSAMSRLRLNWLWMALHITIVFAGIILFARAVMPSR